MRCRRQRTEPKARLSSGQSVRVPPLNVEAPTPRADAPADLRDRAFLKSITLYEDDDVDGARNKPMGLAVQGGSGTTRHVDEALARCRDKAATRSARVWCIGSTRIRRAVFSSPRRGSPRRRSPRRFARARRARFTGRWCMAFRSRCRAAFSNFLAKEQNEEDSVMRLARHGEEGASHAVTYYAVVETAAQQLAGRPPKPVTGRTHQLRAHMQQIGHPIIGDPKYFNIENWQIPGGVQNKRHCWRAGSPCRIHAAAVSTSPRRCRRIWNNPGICSGSISAATTRSRLRRRNERGTISSPVRCDTMRSVCCCWCCCSLLSSLSCTWMLAQAAHSGTGTALTTLHVSGNPPRRARATLFGRRTVRRSGRRAFRAAALRDHSGAIMLLLIVLRPAGLCRAFRSCRAAACREAARRVSAIGLRAARISSGLAGLPASQQGSYMGSCLNQ